MTRRDGRRLSRRQRNVLLTAAGVAAGIALCGFAIVSVHRARQAGPYTPGEANAEITRSLARGVPRDAPTPVFVDATEESGLGGFVTFAGSRSSQLPEDVGPGAAWGDFDGDGDDDLLLVSAGGPLGAPDAELAPTMLFENAGDGTFHRAVNFPEPRIHGMAAAWGDYDGDGWLDLVVTGYNTLLLFRNDRGRLVRDERFRSRNGFWAGAAWGDPDNDGDLDLYVCGYVEYIAGSAEAAKASTQYGRAVPYTLNPASYAPARNLFFRNVGRGRFIEEAEALGIANPEGRSLGAVWHDFDQDGWTDLYVANDISDNVLYRNVQGRFQDVSHAAWVADYRGAMGLAVGDWDRDGDDDLLITHWVAQENALYDSLLKNIDGPLRFVDAADLYGLGQIALPMVGWGAEFVDFDADGWVDLVVANGSTFETDEAPKRLRGQEPFLFWNRGGASFHDLAPLVPALAVPHVARGLAVSDFDRDGDMDVLLTRNNGGVQLLRNDTRQGRWLQIVLRARPNPGGPVTVAVGAQVEARAGKALMRRAVTGGASYLSQSSAVLHFGLGEAAGIDSLVVRWRGDQATTCGRLAGNRVWEITEGDPQPRELGHAPAPVPTASDGAGRERLLTFWERHRAAMRALKSERDCATAAGLFREALAIDPAHEDARYYLGMCLAALGDTGGALAEYRELTRRNARSHRGHAAWGRLRAVTAATPADFAEAEAALERAYRINPEETGVLLALGEVALMRRQVDAAAERFDLACRTNPRAVGGFFLLAYLRWRAGDAAGAEAQLEKARAALGPDWKPAGATAEGDVAGSGGPMEGSLLSRFWERWNPDEPPPAAFQPLHAYLQNAWPR